MKKLKMYCLCLHNKHFQTVKKLGYIPVGLGKGFFSPEWLRDNEGENISNKNEYYGEYTFHYWFWKNRIEQIENNTWIGFCAYRRFWLNKSTIISKPNKNDFLKNIPEEWNNYDTVLGQQFFINKMKFSKMVKHGLSSLINYPPAVFEKNRNIKFHFNSFHGFGKLDKAIDLLDDENREDFRKFTEQNLSFNMGNMFICKSKKIINDYCKKIEGSKTLNKETLEKHLKELMDKHQTNFKGIGQPMRIALTGSKFGPGIYDIILSLEKDEVLKRLSQFN